MSPSKSKAPAEAKPRKSRKEATSEPAVEQPAPVRTPRGKGKAPVDLADALVHAFETNERVNQFLLEQLDASIWDVAAPVGKGRVIRGVFAHVHNVRRLWISGRGEDAEAPARLERDSATVEEARAALAESAQAVVEFVRAALADGGRVKDFKPDVVGFVSYAIAHEAHHRGQVCMLARLLGKPLPQSVGYELWNWRKRAEEARAAPAGS